MIITKTPFRVSFFGGGTDYPDWYRKHGGTVLSTTINKYCYISCRHLPPFFEHKHRISYSEIENVTNIDSIKHPVVREVLRLSNCNYGLEIHHDGDLPARSGLGSSSSFTVGLLHAINGLNGILSSKDSLAKSAINIEQNILNENVGSQDQVAVAYGGFNKIIFNQDDTFHVQPLAISNDRSRLLQDHLMLFFTGFSRISDSIAKSQIENIKNGLNDLNHSLKLVNQAENILFNNSMDLDDFGLLLHESWMMKRNYSDAVTTPEIDFIYELALKAGALGGKILGAGGGGFMLIYAKPDKHESIRTALKDLVNVNFEFENSGSTIAFYQPNNY